MLYTANMVKRAQYTYKDMVLNLENAFSASEVKKWSKEIGFYSATHTGVDGTLAISTGKLDMESYNEGYKEGKAWEKRGMQKCSGIPRKLKTFICTKLLGCKSECQRTGHSVGL